MSEYFSLPTTCDCPDVIERVRREIDQRIWTREDESQDVTAHLREAQLYLAGFLAALDRFGVISVHTLNQLCATVEHELEKAQDAADEDGA